MEWYQSRPIVISLLVIILGLTFLILAANHDAGPPLTAPDRQFIQTTVDYQKEFDEIPVAVGGIPAPVYEHYARQELVLVDNYSVRLSSFTLSEKLYPYRDEIFAGLEDERGSALDMLSAIAALKAGDNSTAQILFDSSLERRRSQMGHLERATMLRQVAERTFWDYLPAPG
jgi:hypothetical protein